METGVGEIALKKNHKTAVSDITNKLHRAGVKVSQCTIKRKQKFDVGQVIQITKHSTFLC